MGYVTITTKCTEFYAFLPGTRIEMLKVGVYYYMIEITEIPSINPLYPPIFGGLLKLGKRPQTPGRKYPEPLF
jgi:hypothetical protein